MPQKETVRGTAQEEGETARVHKWKKKNRARPTTIDDFSMRATWEMHTPGYERADIKGKKIITQKNQMHAMCTLRAW
jgi:hypothetical protein